MNRPNNKFKNNQSYQEYLNAKELEFQRRKRLISQYQQQLEEEENAEDSLEEEYNNESGYSESENYRYNSQEKVGANNNSKQKNKKQKNANSSPSLLQRGKNPVNRLKQGTKKTIKIAKKTKSLLNSFLGKYKIYILIGSVILFLFFLLILMSLDMFVEAEDGGGNGSGSGTQGYYEESCDFNNTTIDYTAGDNVYENISLDDFVIGSTYAYIKEGDYSNETIKTLLIVNKTNALSYGNYNNSSQHLTLSQDSIKYYDTADIEITKYNKILNIYNTASDEIYLSSSYTGTISALSSADALQLNEANINKIEELQSSMEYTDILDNVYNANSDKQIYKIEDNCTFYNVTENDAWWWPIGSSEETADNIYGGTPTSTRITSYFGPRNIAGTSDNHGAIDIDGQNNTDVIIATKDGVVKQINLSCDNNGSYGNKCGNGFGNNVRIDHGDGMLVIYAHMYPESITVKVGDTVKQGQKIGMVGNSGSSTGDHLHFEVKLNGEKVDPLNYVDPENPRPVSKYSIPSTSDNVIDPTDVKIAVCESLLESGYSKNAVAGIMVNMEHEGSWKVNNLENCYEKDMCCTINGKNYGYCVHPEIGDFGSDEAYTNGVNNGNYPKETYMNDRAGYGLIQWTSSGRKAGLYDKAKSQSKSIANVGVQLDWMLEEIKAPGYATTYKYITGNYSAQEIALNFCLDFERPSNKDTACSERAANSTQSMLTFVNNGCK